MYFQVVKCKPPPQKNPIYFLAGNVHAAKIKPSIGELKQGVDKGMFFFWISAKCTNYSGKHISQMSGRKSLFKRQE